MKGHVIFDCDEVLLEYIPSIVNWLKKEKGLVSKCDINEIDYHFTKAYDLTSEQIKNHIIEYSLSDDFAKIDFINGAEEVIFNLKRNGYKISILTSAGIEQKVIDSRAKNLAHLPIDDLVVLPLAGRKLEYLQKMEKGIFVDDLIKNIKDGDIAGHKTILKRRSHNKYINHSIVIDNLDEIFNHT